MEVLTAMPVLECQNPKCRNQWRPVKAKVQRCPKCHWSEWVLVPPKSNGKAVQRG